MFFSLYSDILFSFAEVFFGMALLFILFISLFTQEISQQGISKVKVLWLIPVVLSVVCCFYYFFLVTNTPGVYKDCFFNQLCYSWGYSHVKLFLTFLAISYFIVLWSAYRNSFVFFTYEFIILCLCALLSSFILINSNSLLTFYLALELQSLSFYILAAFDRRSSFCTEAGLKYYVIGAFSSGFFLFGCSLIYGGSGSCDFNILSELFANGFCNVSSSFFCVSGLLFLFTGISFKLAVAPWHFWVVDVYEGSPTISVLFFSIFPKMPIVICLFKLFLFSFLSCAVFWQSFFWIAAFLSFIFGVGGAIFQKNLKRFFAFSSISHFGFIYFAISTATYKSVEASFIYLFLYLITSFCIWIFLFYFESSKKKKFQLSFSDLRAFGRNNLVAGFTFCLLLFSMAGIPPIGGFYAKAGIFFCLLESQFYITSLLLVFFSAVSCYYYLRIVKICFFDKNLLPVQFSFNKTNFFLSFFDSCFLSFACFFICLCFLFPSGVDLFCTQFIF